MAQRKLSLAYLSSHRCAPHETIQIAAATGYDYAGLRLWPNSPGAPQQHLIGQPQALRETRAVIQDTGVGVWDLELIRINAEFEAHTWDALLDVGAALNAKAILVAGDDTDPVRLTENFARLCDIMRPYGMTADLEFMPWTAVPDARSALRVITQAGTPVNAGILVDALHVGRSHTRLDDLRAIPRHLLHYAQICDGLEGTHFSSDEMIHTARCARELPGEGNIDLRGIFAALPDELPVSVEVVNFQQEALTSPQAWAARCMAASRPYLT